MRARVAPVGRSNRRGAVGRAAGWESWIDLYGDLAGILTLAGKKWIPRAGPLTQFAYKDKPPLRSHPL
jgi:hypothetical protein